MGRHSFGPFGGVKVVLIVDLIWLDCCSSFQDFCGMLVNHKNVGIRNDCTQSIVWWVGGLEAGVGG